jgi:hypothetical protein
MENENDDIYRNLVILLRMFKNRPHHLAKYLIENSALSIEFIKNIKDSQRLQEISDDDIDQSYFSNISQMENYFNSLTDIDGRKSITDITRDLNKKLDDCLKLEKYEDAARIRDYMNRKGIHRIIF